LGSVNEELCLVKYVFRDFRERWWGSGRACGPLRPRVREEGGGDLGEKESDIIVGEEEGERRRWF
jgi:hypothetical protein